jgi:hypothetical protein
MGQKALLLVAHPTKCHAVLDTASPYKEVAGQARNDSTELLM